MVSLAQSTKTMMDHNKPVERIKDFDRLVLEDSEARLKAKRDSKKKNKAGRALTFQVKRAMKTASNREQGPAAEPERERPSSPLAAALQGGFNFLTRRGISRDRRNMLAMGGAFQVSSAIVGEVLQAAENANQQDREESSAVVNTIMSPIASRLGRDARSPAEQQEIAEAIAVPTTLEETIVSNEGMATPVPITKTPMVGKDLTVFTNVILVIAHLAPTTSLQEMMKRFLVVGHADMNSLSIKRFRSEGEINLDSICSTVQVDNAIVGLNNEGVIVCLGNMQKDEGCLHVVWNWNSGATKIDGFGEFGPMVSMDAMGDTLLVVSAKGIVLISKLENGEFTPAVPVDFDGGVLMEYAALAPNGDNFLVIGWPFGKRFPTIVQYKRELDVYGFLVGVKDEPKQSKFSTMTKRVWDMSSIVWGASNDTFGLNRSGHIVRTDTTGHDTVRKCDDRLKAIKVGMVCGDPFVLGITKDGEDGSKLSAHFFGSDAGADSVDANGKILSFDCSSISALFHFIVDVDKGHLKGDENETNKENEDTLIATE